MASEKDDILAEDREAFELSVEREADNRARAVEDLRFGRLGEQWPDEIRQARKGRPMLTINKMPAFSRQVVNDARQNKPSIRVHPVDSGADKETAEVINGLIRNIETISNADVAYDTATGFAVDMGWGYWKVDLDYAHDDTFDMDLLIKPVANPFSIWGDPHSDSADSSDWKSAFEGEWLTHKDFEAQFGDKDKVDWESYCEGVKDRHQWVSDDSVFIAKRWKREEITRKIYRMTDGQILSAEALEKEVDPTLAPGLTLKDALDLQGVTIQAERDTKSWKVIRRILTGAEVLKTEDWPGIYIPIIPVYGDDVNVEGERYLRSLIHDAKDAQRMFNYWRTTATELVALAPRVPYLGEEGSFVNPAKWATANSANHAYLEYGKGRPMPQRQPMDTGAAAGALQEALNASDDMKAIMGLYDASLGARSNETSGKAILARQREGDVSTFHFQDNMSRAIRHTGRILIDLIPKVYNQERVIRVLGEDGTPKNVPLKQEVQEPVTDEEGQPVMDQAGQPVMRGRIYDLAAGKYDLTVTTGPSFSTRREEAANQMMQFVQAFPAAAPVVGDLLASNLDWPQADEIGQRLKALLPPQTTGGLAPEIQKQMEQMGQQLQALQQENQILKAKAADRTQTNQIKAQEVQIKGYEAETDRIQALKPEPPQVVQPRGEF